MTKKRCKECEGKGEECKCPEKRKKGWYGLDIHDKDDDNDQTHDGPMDSMDGGGGLGEGIKMPKEPSHKQLDGMSTSHKRKKLADFKAATDEAKKRQSDKKRSDELYMERKRKGIKFYDSKGTGYIRDGKKHYD